MSLCLDSNPYKPESVLTKLVESTEKYDKNNSSFYFQEMKTVLKRVDELANSVIQQSASDNETRTLFDEKLEGVTQNMSVRKTDIANLNDDTVQENKIQLESSACTNGTLASLDEKFRKVTQKSELIKSVIPFNEKVRILTQHMSVMNSVQTLKMKRIEWALINLSSNSYFMDDLDCQHSHELLRSILLYFRAGYGRDLSNIDSSQKRHDITLFQMEIRLGMDGKYKIYYSVLANLDDDDDVQKYKKRRIEWALINLSSDSYLMSDLDSQHSRELLRSILLYFRSGYGRDLSNMDSSQKRRDITSFQIEIRQGVHGKYTIYYS